MLHVNTAYNQVPFIQHQSSWKFWKCTTDIRRNYPTKCWCYKTYLV